MTKKEIKHRNTKQRKIILSELKSVTSHPTADQIFQMVQKKMPEIGLATVYRNLDYLVKTKQIIRLRSKDTVVRYDGCSEKHCHLICKGCNKVFDLFDVEKITIKSKELNKLGFKFDPSYAEMFGLCKNCNKLFNNH